MKICFSFKNPIIHYPPSDPRHSTGCEMLVKLLDLGCVIERGGDGEIVAKHKSPDDVINKLNMYEKKLVDYRCSHRAWTIDDNGNFKYLT